MPESTHGTDNLAPVGPRVSIVVPAHNEEMRITGLLETLSVPAQRGDYAVFVVCNDCSDNTAQVASSFPGITVVEAAERGKAFALNEGDRLAGDVFPRIYCDADLRISAESIDALVACLDTDEVVAAGPRVEYACSESAWVVRQFCAALETPVIAEWLAQHLVGRGLYGLSRRARSRFGRFPSLVADDLFVDTQFALEEKAFPEDCVATVWVPTSTLQLLRQEVRVAEGNREFRRSSPGGEAQDHAKRLLAAVRGKGTTLRRWMSVVGARDLAPLTTYVAILALTRARLMLRHLQRREVSWR